MKKPWTYKPISVAPNETKAANARLNIQAEIAARLDRAKIWCVTTGDTKASEGMTIVADWKEARKLLLVLREKGIGS